MAKRGAVIDEVVLDGDILLYSVGFAIQKNIYVLHEEGRYCAPVLTSSDKRKINEYIKVMESPRYEQYLQVQAPMSGYITIDSQVRKYKEMFDVDNLTIYLTGKGNFREDVAKMAVYKGNRDDAERPFHYDKLKKYLVKKHRAFIIDGEEADDALSKAIIKNPKALLVSDDKDLLNTPGYHLRPRKGDEVLFVSEYEADRNFYKQLITGDATDNIPGLRGYGPAKAAKIVDACTSIEEIECEIGKLYATFYNDPQRAMIEVGQLLWMRREDNEMWYPQFMGGPKSE